MKFLKNLNNYKKIKILIIKPAIEEPLRYRSPVQFLFRITNANVTLSEGREDVGYRNKNTERSMNNIVFGFYQL
ncbi:MAG TPA: hypothetical protein VE595_01880 [Nitrososphaeraceae archaeon]|nr:hypothetical protein [Nitrososphaeraceae archaeon]